MKQAKRKAAVKLKPCPFCGQKAKVISPGVVGCGSKLCRVAPEAWLTTAGPAVRGDTLGAIQIWNTRRA